MSEQDKYNNILEALRQKAAEILPKGSRVALYGSRARGDARADSDWDLHVLIPGEDHLTVDDDERYGAPFYFLGLDFGEIINARVYTVSGWLRRNFLPFYKNVEREKLIIYNQ